MNKEDEDGLSNLMIEAVDSLLQFHGNLVRVSFDWAQVALLRSKSFDLTYKVHVSGA